MTMADEGAPPERPPQDHQRQAQPPQAGEPQVVYVERRGNGMAVASLVLGIIGVVFGLVPLTGFIAIILGVLAVIFGFIGRGNAKKKGLERGGMATAGLILGFIALGLGIWGLIIVGEVFEELERQLEEL
jgi:hypothetical protein